jgi:two-component system nitrogen regulation sensor histidine kinase NtrY
LARRIGIRRRLTFAMLVTAVIPVAFAVWLAETTVRQTSARFFVPEVGARLERSLELYQELAHAVKAGMKSEAAGLAADEPLRRAAVAHDREGTERALRRVYAGHPNLVSLGVRDGDKVLVEVNRGRALDARTENRFEVVRPLTFTPEPAPSAAPASSAKASSDDRPDAPPVEDDEPAAGPELVAVFAADKARFDELAEASQFVESYRRIERRRITDERSYVLAFAALLGLTIGLAVFVGSALARDVAKRVVGLEQATQLVAAGDLSVRVPDTATDELGALAREFNRMLAEVETSRARIEYLQRISSWQEMARRLAHEIKNPLTPIQLAVQEIHRRYEGTSADFQKLLDTTLEVVEDEVGTLRRLVGEFSDFARLPQAELESADLCEFLRELAERPLLAEDERRSDAGPPSVGPKIDFEIPDGVSLARIDRQMLRRVVINLVRNAAQALSGAKRAGRVLVRLTRQGDTFCLDVEDDGPGIPSELRQAIFDPYVTTKTDGTGLGLAIVKKIVVEHHGTIVAEESTLGGARLRVRLPVTG